MKKNELPMFWLIVLLIGLPHLSEAVYTPSLPDVVHSLQSSEAEVEYTLTIYLFGFSLGTLFWGKLSDNKGRKSCVIMGLLIFVFGCIGCYESNSIMWLMINRFIQAFGGSSGSILGQAICRDTFHGAILGKVYSLTSIALGILTAIGPIIGGFITEKLGWHYIFLFLIISGSIVISIMVRYLIETHPKKNRQSKPILYIASILILDRNVIGLAIIVAGCNGISFSYLAEGPFYLITLLGLTSSQYGLSFLAIAFSSVLGGIISRKLHSTLTSEIILGYGLRVIIMGCVVSSCIMLCYELTIISKAVLIFVTVISQMTIFFGIFIVTSTALAMALKDYKWCIGTASSLFGFFYYSVIALFTLGMGILHNGTLLPMPLYFLIISLFMWRINKLLSSK